MNKISFARYSLFNSFENNSHLFRCRLQKLIVALALFMLLLFIAAPATAAVEGIIAKNDHSYYQFYYEELLESYALKILGHSNGLYEEYTALQPYALLDSTHGCISYQDVLDNYAGALALGKNFCLKTYIENGSAKKLELPISLKTMSLTSVPSAEALSSEKNKTAVPSSQVEKENEAAAEPQIPNTSTSIVAPVSVTLDQALNWARSCNAHERFINIAEKYWNLGEKTGMRPEVLYAQAAYETGFGRYGGNVPPDYNNWAGIKTADANGNTPADHEKFASPEEGARAHYNHMAAYVGLDPLGEPHGRYHIVARLSWSGSVETVEELSGKWAPSPTYHVRIVEMVEEMKKQ